MSIVLTHMLGETDDGVLDPKEHRKLQKERPGMKLSWSRELQCLSRYCQTFDIWRC